MRRYLFSYDNPRNGDYGLFERRISRVATLQSTATRTAWIIYLDQGGSGKTLRNALKGILHPRKGAATLHSKQNNKLRKIDNRGNRRNQWVLEAY